MTSFSPHSRWQLTSRDRELLAALFQVPLGVAELLELSRTFPAPFHSPDRVRKRLQHLAAAGLVQGWRSAVVGDAGGSAPLYYKLTLAGYRTLREDEAAVPPTKRFFQETAIGRHRHQQALGRFVVRTQVAAHRQGLCVTETAPENTVRIETPYGPFYPDLRMRLRLPDGRELAYCVELDNSTETIVSAAGRESIDLKLRKYLHDLRGNPQAYRVLFVVTGAKARAQHIVETLRSRIPATNYSPVYVVTLNDYLTTDNPFLDPICASPRNPRIGLIRSYAEPLTRPVASQVTPLAQPAPV
jgi:hypothetical protein